MPLIKQRSLDNVDTLIKLNLLKSRVFSNIGGIKRLRCPRPLFVGIKTFIKTTTKGDAFLIYVLPSPNVEPCPHKISS